jgi:hypothetical protein
MKSMDSDTYAADKLLASFVAFANTTATAGTGGTNGV